MFIGFCGLPPFNIQPGRKKSSLFVTDKWTDQRTFGIAVYSGFEKVREW